MSTTHRSYKLDTGTVADLELAAFMTGLTRTELIEMSLRATLAPLMASIEYQVANDG